MNVSNVALPGEEALPHAVNIPHTHAHAHYQIAFAFEAFSREIRTIMDVKHKIGLTNACKLQRYYNGQVSQNFLPKPRIDTSLHI